MKRCNLATAIAMILVYITSSISDTLAEEAQSWSEDQNMTGTSPSGPFIEDELQQLNPKASMAEVQAGKSAQKRMDYNSAVDSFTRAIALNPKNAMAYNLRGSTYFKLNRHDLAINDFNSAIALQPHGSAHFYHRGNVYYDIGKFEQAIENYTEAIQLQPDYVKFYYMRCLAYKQMKENDKAITDCLKVLDLSPKHKSARKQLELLDTERLLPAMESEREDW